MQRDMGLHVHISPAWSRPDWDPDVLKSFCLSIFHVEGAIEAIVPHHRRHNIWATNNYRDNEVLRGKSVEACAALVDACTSVTVKWYWRLQQDVRWSLWKMLMAEMGGLPWVGSTLPTE